MAAKSLRQVIGSNVRQQRMRAGISQRGLGDHLGVTAQQIQKYENGSNSIAAERLIVIAAFVGCEVMDLYTGTDSQKSHGSRAKQDPFLIQKTIESMHKIKCRKTRRRVSAMVDLIASSAR